MTDTKWRQIKIITMVINVLPVFLWICTFYEYSYIKLAATVSLVQMIVNMFVIVLVPLKENDYKRLENSIKTLKSANDDLFEENKSLYKEMCRRNYLESIKKENDHE